MDERVILGPECVAEGADWLASNVPRFAPLIERLSPLPLRLKPEGFLTLLDIINGQQVSTASAAAINKRVREAGLTTPEAIADATDETLKSIGFSHQKIRYARGLAASGLDYAALRGQSSEVAFKQLIALPGIGPWTAQIYVKFSLGRADVFASGDLALQEAVRLIWAMEERPTAKSLDEMAKAWSPWRSVAARLLWAYYAEQKTREGIA